MLWSGIDEEPLAFRRKFCLLMLFHSRLSNDPSDPVRIRSDWATVLAHFGQKEDISLSFQNLLRI